MKKFILLAIFVMAAMIVMDALAAPKSLRRKFRRGGAPNEIVSVITNEAGKVSRVVTVNSTNVIWFIDKDFEIPFKYRKIWNTMTEDEREQFKTKITLESSGSTETSTVLVYPKKIEETDDNVSEETKLIRVRY